MKTNIIYGASTYMTMKESSQLNHNIIKFDTVFSIVDLDNVDKYKITLPKCIYNEDIEYIFEDEIKRLDDVINNGEDIRIWTSHLEVNSYLLFLYLCNYLQGKKINVYVVYSDEYDKDCYSPSCMHASELESLTNFEHKLTEEDIKNYASEWNKIKNENSEMRVLENSEIKSVSFDYYNDIILDRMKELGEVKLSRFTGLFMADYYMADMVIVYLVNRLIDKGKIKITKISDEREFENMIAVA